MPYPAGTVKIAVTGSMLGGEEFSFGWQLDAGGSAGQAACDSAVADIASYMKGTNAPKFQIFLQTLQKFDKVTAYAYNGDSTAAAVATAIINLAGAGNSPPLPNQVAVVASLLTGLPGASKRGRMYLPGTSLAAYIQASTGQMELTQADIFATTLAGLLKCTDDSGIGGINIPAAVCSVTKGTKVPVVTVAVDTRFDVQRRRANSQRPTGIAYHQL